VSGVSPQTSNVLASELRYEISATFLTLRQVGDQKYSRMIFIEPKGPLNTNLLENACFPGLKFGARISQHQWRSWWRKSVLAT